MEKYSEYKDSGVKWLGEIPSHWEIKKLRAGLTERREKWNSSEALIILSLLKDKGVIPYTEKGEVGNKSKEDHSQYKIARKGDLVINSMNVIIGSLGITQFDGYISPAYYSFKPRENINLSYFNYILSLRGVQQSIRCYSKGIMEIRLKITSNDFLSMPFPFPSLEEQNAIVTNLDVVINNIDIAIAQQQKMIDLLNERKQIIINRAVTKGLNPNAKMKDSGVEWIGEVPEHWEVRSFKTMMAIQRGHDLTAEEFKMGEIPVYGSGGLMGFHNVVTSKGPSIVIGRSGSVGKLQYIEEDFWAHNTAIYLTDNKGNDTKYLYYLLKSVDLSALATQTAVPTLDRKNVLSYKVPCCLDKIEQEEISHYLDGVLSKIDQMISTVNGKISLLQERKQIIINEVVTGKVKVV